MGKYNHQVTVSGLPFGSPFTLSVPGSSGGNRGGDGKRGGGGGKRGGGGGNVKAKNKKNQRCWRCKEKGHYGSECKYQEEEASAKKAEFLKKKKKRTLLLLPLLLPLLSSLHSQGGSQVLLCLPHLLIIMMSPWVRKNATGLIESGLLSLRTNLQNHRKDPSLKLV
ncbi:uncharacterized protein LOC118435058 [Folsomia candida]|nr:uncharacterized protein LOC118435058 [Folsomia candida]